MAIDREQTKAAIYRALEGETEAFKLTVLDIAYENQWNPNDPSFLLLAATGQLRALLRLHPAEIKAAMAEALAQAKQEWSKWHTKTLTVATGTELTAQRMTAQLQDVQRLIQAEREEMAALMAAERAALAQQMQQMAQQQEQVLIAQTNELIAQAVIKSQARAAAQVKEIVESAKAKHYTAALRWTGMAALGYLLVAWVTFSQVHRFSTWGQYEQWNQQPLKDCVAVNSNTCNIHIKPP